MLLTRRYYCHGDSVTLLFETIGTVFIVLSTDWRPFESYDYPGW